MQLAAVCIYMEYIYGIQITCSTAGKNMEEELSLVESKYNMLYSQESAVKSSCAILNGWVVTCKHDEN